MTDPPQEHFTHHGEGNNTKVATGNRGKQNYKHNTKLIYFGVGEHTLFFLCLKRCWLHFASVLSVGREEEK